MNEPSKEALTIAWALVERAVARHELGPLFADELQKLMDERNVYYAQFTDAADRSAANFARAEAAERKLAELVSEVRAQYGQYHICEKLLANYT